MALHTFCELGEALVRGRLSYEGPAAEMEHLAKLSHSQRIECLLAAVLGRLDDLDGSQSALLAERLKGIPHDCGATARLWKAGVRTIADAIGLGAEGLQAREGVGPATVEALRRALHRHGLLLPYRGVELPPDFGDRA